MAKINPITLAVVRNNLMSTAREMRETILRTSVSTIIYEDFDFACGLLDWDGGLLTEASGLTMFMGTLPPAIKKCLETIGIENVTEEDIFFATTPLYTGSHPPEGMIFAPIFHKNKLFGYAADKGHLVDFGGKEPYPTDSTDPFQEGLRIPPVKLYPKGRLNQEIKSILMYNSRAPEIIWGEIQAQVGAAITARERVKKLLDKYGFELVSECVREINNIAERETREALEVMPHGTWTGEDMCDYDGINKNKPIKIKMSFTIQKEGMIIDYTGSDEQQQGPMNVPIISTISGSRLMLKLITAPGTSAHEGSFRPLEVIAPWGSVFNVDPNKAPTMLYGWPLMSALELMFKMLSPVLPDRLVACSGGDLGALLRYGWHKDTGKWWSEGSIEGCGQGASYFSDGGNALIQIAEACSRNLPCEVEETRAPVIVERYELQQDSGGPGQFRGGLGVRRDWRLTGTGNLIAVSERGIAPHSGVMGGGPGRRNYAVVRSANPSFEKYSFGKDDDGLVILKTPSTPLFPGDYVSIRQGGGGGWGDPRTRKIELVEADVRSGYVSIGAARTEYGVVVDSKTLKVDRQATKNLRG